MFVVLFLLGFAFFGCGFAEATMDNTHAALWWLLAGAAMLALHALMVLGERRRWNRRGVRR